MTLFQAVKGNVTTRQAAERYGIKVSKNGMCCCPFHNDRHPSMKVDSRYYCFACNCTGDVIDFTAFLFHMEPAKAAMKLAEDFTHILSLLTTFNHYLDILLFGDEKDQKDLLKEKEEKVEELAKKYGLS